MDLVFAEVDFRHCDAVIFAVARQGVAFFGGHRIIVRFAFGADTRLAGLVGNLSRGFSVQGLACKHDDKNHDGAQWRARVHGIDLVESDCLNGGSPLAMAQKLARTVSARKAETSRTT
jgi:hypothetical protein